MKRKTVFMATACMVLFVVYAYAMRIFQYEETISLTITSAGDTAMVMKMTPSFGVDSFMYFDTIDVGAAGASATRTRVAWQAPNTVWRVFPDSVKNSTAYVCSLFTSGNGYALSWTSPGSGTTAAMICDSLRLHFDSIATVKDTVDAEDSTTYVKVKARFAEFSMPGDTAFRLSANRTGADYLRFTADTITVAMVCDTMVVKYNATVAISDTITARDSTTFYTITSDQKGLSFRLIGVGGAYTDTTKDSLTLQVNVASFSSVTDTVFLGNTSDVGAATTWDATSMLYKAQLVSRRATADTIGHSGFLDSATIHLYTISPVDGSWFFLDSLVGAVVTTNTLSHRYVKTGLTSGTGIDTLLKGPLAVIIRVVDSTSDTTKTTANMYKFKANYWLK